MEEIKSITEEESEQLSGMTSAIVDAITKKAMYEMKECNRDNPTFLGGIRFYFAQTPKGPYLVWDKHPKEWDERKIKEDIDELEHYFMQLRGLVE